MSEREAYWRELIDEHESSGLSVAEFCEWQEVSTASFYQWRKRFRDSVATAMDAPMFVPVSVVDEVSASSLAAAIEIALPNGCVVRVADGVSGETMALALAAAGELSC